MSNCNIIFLNHASFILEHKSTKILVDPYLFGSSFNDGWRLLKEVDHDNEINEISHIFFSHEHPAHFSIPFLKKIQEEKRKYITILYQKTYDNKVKNFCKKLNYNFIELDDCKSFKLTNEIEITIGKVPFYDSWINFKIGQTNILNVNDCVLEQIDTVHKIKKVLNRKIDVLFTQFSYANYIEQQNQKYVAKKQLENIKIQDQVLQPSFIIPFASFIYFSHTENKFMNENVNTVDDAYNYILKECKAKPIILKPNEKWHLENKNNLDSLKFWKNIYNDINNLKFTNPDKSKNINELIDEGKKYLNKLKSKNNRFLIYVFSRIGFFSKTIIYIKDLKIFASFDLLNGLEIIKKSGIKKFVSLNSNSLFFIFNFDYGLDTTLINARLECDTNYLQKFKRVFILGSLNNTGRYLSFLNFFKFLNLNFFLRGLNVIFNKKFYLSR